MTSERLLIASIKVLSLYLPKNFYALPKQFLAMPLETTDTSYF